MPECSEERVVPGDAFKITVVRIIPVCNLLFLAKKFYRSRAFMGALDDGYEESFKKFLKAGDASLLGRTRCFEG